MDKSILRYGVGLDISKKEFQACVAKILESDEVKIIATKKFPNTPSGFKLFEEWIHKKKKEKNLKLRILMEVTGVYHENLLHHLFDSGFEVVLETGKRVKKFKEVIGFKSKNDKLDAKAICIMACRNYGKIWAPISKHILQVRSALRHRKSLIAKRVQCENQIEALLHSKYPFKDIEKSLNRLIKMLKSEIESTEKKAFKYAERDKEMIEKVNMIVDSVKGLGLLTVLTVVAETNGFHDFRNSKQLVSYAGYDIVENQSGKFSGTTKISKIGNAQIRMILHMGSVSVIRYKIKPFYNLYMRLLKRNGRIKKKAMVAVQRKLLILIYTLWNKNEAFDMDYYKQIENIELEMVKV
jgi:transposase